MPKFIVATETAAYGTTPSTGWRGFRPKADGHKTKQKTLQHVGIGARTGAPSASGRRIVDLGGEGSIELPGASNGLGVLLRAAASTAASAVVSGGTLAYEQVYTFGSASAPSGRTLSVEIHRDRMSGTEDAFTYAGGKPTSLEVSQDTDGLLMLKWAMDYLSVTRQGSVPSRTVTWPAPEVLYAWEDALITLTNLDDSSDETECLKDFSLTIPLELDTEDYCIKKGTTKHEPSRKGVPAPTGELNWKYQHPRYYDAFVAGTQFSLSAFWEGYDAIEGSTLPSLLIEVPVIAFSGEDPELSESEATMQKLPFEVLDNGTDPAATITIVTSDTTY